MEAMTLRLTLILAMALGGCSREHEHKFSGDWGQVLTVEDRYVLHKIRYKCECGQLLFDTNWTDMKQIELNQVKRQLGYRDAETEAIWQ